MVSPAVEVPVCLCGQNMHATHVGDIFFCLNCDRAQEGIPTLQTREYNRKMIVREEREGWYPDVPPRRRDGG